MGTDFSHSDSMAAVAVIADADYRIEGNAVQQLHTTAVLLHMRHVSGMICP